MLKKNKFKKKKVLLIGKNGFFAKNLIKNFNNFNNFKNFKLILVGREDEITKFNLKKMDVIINCASDIYNEKLMFKNNTIFIYKLLHHYIKSNSKAKIIHFGTASEYGINDTPSKENDLIKPSTIYGGTKAAGTILIQSFSKQFKIPSVILRSYTAYGPFENSSKLLPSIFRHLIHKKKLILYEGFQDYYYIDDLCDIVIKLILKWNKKFYGEIINISSGRQYSNKQILKFCEKIINQKAEPTLIKKFQKIFHNKIWIGDSKKRLNLKFKLPTKVEDGIQKYYQEILTNKELKLHVKYYKSKPFTKLI